MFGMLDYRAHKLLWLLLLPVAIFFRLLFFVIVFASILIAYQITNISFFQIIVAFIVMEIAGFIFYLFGCFVEFFIKKVFFWVVDIIPAYGADHEEAKAVVLFGGD